MTLPQPHRCSTLARDSALRVIVVDDNAAVVEAVIEVLGYEGVAVVGSAGTAQAGIELAASERPDVALVDLRMPGGGVHATRGIREASPHTAVLILTANDSDTARRDCFAAGAAGYLVKGRDDLVAAVLDRRWGES